MSACQLEAGKTGTALEPSVVPVTASDLEPIANGAVVASPPPRLAPVVAGVFECVGVVLELSAQPVDGSLKLGVL